MIRFLGYLLRLILVIAVVLWLANQPGNAHIVWHDWVIDTSAAALVGAAFLVGFVFYLAFRLWHFLRSGPALWRMNRRISRMRQGQDDLTQALIALASGNGAEAGRLAISARKMLGATTATQFLQAQAAELAGDHRAAHEMFQSLADSADGMALGYRGLILQARRQGQWETITELAAQWGRVQPDTPWLQSVQLEIATRRQDWAGAERALNRLANTALIDPSTLRRYRATLALAAARKAQILGATDKALSAAEQAFHQEPDWLPAILMLAQTQEAAGHARAARRTIEKNWAHYPHPQLLASYQSLIGDPTVAYKKLENLSSDDSSADMRVLLAEAALAADIWGEARRQLIAIIARKDAPQAAFKLMARLERRENVNSAASENAAQLWLAKAVTASADPAFICASCGSAHEEWAPTCKSCDSFATLDWRRPLSQPHSILPSSARKLLPGATPALNLMKPLTINDWIA